MYLLAFRALVDRIDPIDRLRLLDWIDIADIDDDGLVIGPNQHAFEHIVRIGVYLLMRDIGRHKYKIARTGLCDVFEMIAPAHPSFAPDHEDHALQCPMMMHTGLGVRFDGNRTSPYLLRADTCVIDRGLPEHPRSLCGVGIKLVALDDPNAVVLPAVRFVGVIVLMVMMVVGHILFPVIG